MTSRQPNIVLIMSDQHNPHVMGCAGDEVVQTPNLDALADSGVRFDACYCPYPLCVPARMGFMTAQYPSDVDVWDNGNILDSNVRTFAHALGDAGYETALCGRMHFLGPDQFHGFEKRIYGDCFGFLSDEIQGTGYNRTNGQTRYAVEVTGHGRMGFQEFDKRVTEHACDYLASRDDPPAGRSPTAGDGPRPYCLVVGMVLPHNPLICERELFEYYMEKLPVPEPVSRDTLDSLHPAIRAWRERRGVDALTPEQHHRGRAAYYGLVTEMDRNIGRVIDAVKASPAASRPRPSSRGPRGPRERGLGVPGGAEDTVIIYCTDHGDLAGEHGMWWKSSYYEGSVRVPLIVSCPSRFAGGRAVGSVASLIDVGPTLIELAGAEPLANVSGRSLAAFLETGEAPADWPNETFAEYVGGHGDKPSCMIRSGPWKLMRYSEFDGCLLFNLDEDPGELADRAADPACAEVVRELLAKVRARFSPERMLAGNARQRARWKALRRELHTGTDPTMHETPADDANVFDFSQVPGWEAIRRRVASEHDKPGR